jgi:lipoprotein-releasing system permease protein
MARRITTDKTGGTRISRLMVRIAMATVAISIAVMIIAIAVTSGFQYEIRNKAVALTGHIILTNYDSNHTYDATPVSIERVGLPELLEINGVRYVQSVATKGGIIKMEKDILGAILKGVDGGYDFDFFRSCLIEGNIPLFNDTVLSNDVLIPLRLAKQLHLTAGDRFDMYFVQEPPRVRRFTVGGIYNAQLDDMVDALIICDIKHIRRLNGWTNDQVATIEVFVDDFAYMDSIAEEIDDREAYLFAEKGGRLKVQTVTDLYQHLFDWLALFDMNVWIILILMLLVAGFNMISGLLILVFEKMSMIGLLKSLGMRNASVQRVFLYRAAFIALKGMVWGNAIALLLCLLQQHFHIVSLDPASYYLDTVPILLHPFPILLVNFFGFIGLTLLLALPVLIISRISPSRTIKAD